MRTAEPHYVEINCLGLRKGAEVYVFLYDDASRRETLRTLARFATTPDLDFTWFDAAVLSKRIRDEYEERKPKPKTKGQKWAS